MENAIIAILAVLIGLTVGAIGGYLVRNFVYGRRYAAAQSEAAQILEDTQEQKRSIILEAKEEALKFRSEAETELRERRSEVQRIERRVANREENVERRSNNLERRERNLTNKEKAADDIRNELEELKQQQLQQLEAVANLPISEA